METRMSHRFYRSVSLFLLVVPAAFAFLWNSSSESYHVRQLERARRLLVRALQEVMPGTFG
jgi:hypothetical protein